MSHGTATGCRNDPPAWAPPPRERALRMDFASCYLPDHDEDSHFGHREAGVVGVADGVSSYRLKGVDAGAFARALMANAYEAADLAVTISRGARLRVCPHALLETAYERAARSCTPGAHGGHRVSPRQLSGGRTSATAHRFNCSYQLRGGGSDVADAEVGDMPVADGDVVVVGTDGLFENVFDVELEELVREGRAIGLSPQEMADNIAATAREMARRRLGHSSFSLENWMDGKQAKELFFGGKIDDITVIVAFIVSSESMEWAVRVLPRHGEDTRTSGTPRPASSASRTGSAGTATTASPPGRSRARSWRAPWPRRSWRPGPERSGASAPRSCWPGRTRRPSPRTRRGRPPPSSCRSTSRLSGGRTSATAPSRCSGAARSCAGRCSSRVASTARSSSAPTAVATASVSKAKVGGMSEVRDGDVLVVGTDGLFDNMHGAQLENIVCRGTGLRFSPKKMAHAIARAAYETSKDKRARSPFSIAYQNAFRVPYRGGKKDDITVTVANIVSKEEGGERGGKA
ncbi:hypothetical protein ACP70R_026601 [Stipagrostis hirtigluma subsp. patula]